MMNGDVIQRLNGLAGAGPLELHRDGYWMHAPDLDVRAIAQVMNELGFRLSTLSGVGFENGELSVVYHFTHGAEAINFKTRTHACALPSITPLIRAADWIEREIHDLFGVKFEGHPNLARLIRPPQLPEGFFRAEPTHQAEL